MTQYYIRTDGNNSNTGLTNTAGGAWLTLQKAANTVVAGDTVNVADGTYAGSISETTSGSAGGRIVYQSTNRWGAIITPSGVGTNTLCNFTGGYVDLLNFKIDGTGGTSVRNGVSMTGGNSNMRGCFLYKIATNSGCDSQGGSGWRCDQSGNSGVGTQNYEVTENLVLSVGGTCVYIAGIYHQSTGKIQNNIVGNCAQGIQCGHDDHDIIVSNNTLFQCTNNAYYFGGCLEAYNNGCPTSGMLFYNNIVYDNPGPHAAAGPVSAEDVGNELKYNCWFGNTANFSLAGPSQASRSNEQNVDPKFVNYQTDGTGSFSLSSTSAMIGNGFATYAPAADFYGNTRPNPPSIGAVEPASGQPPSEAPAYRAKARGLTHSTF